MSLEQEFQKLAEGKLPLAAAVALPILGYSLMKGMSNRVDEDKQKAVAEYELARSQAAANNAGDVQALRGGRQLDPYSALLYQQARSEESAPDMAGLDKGAARAAERVGRALAKQAGIGSLIKPMAGLAGSALGTAKGLGKSLVGAAPVIGKGTSWKTKALIGGGLLGAGYAGAKGTQAAINYGNKPIEPKVPNKFNPPLPRYTNEWGQPSF